MTALYFFPDYSAGNPFQTMLHAQLGAVGADPVAVSGVVDFLSERARSGEDPGVLALHWTGPILHWADGPFRARLLLDRFIGALEEFHAAGGRLLWTVHNVLPHEVKHRWAEVELAQLLADRADVVHLLSAASLAEVVDTYRLDPAKVVVVEHSSYLGYYPDTIDRDEARSQLGLAPTDTALLAFGGIRAYKGLDLLLDVVEDLGAADPALRLLVAGRAAEDPALDRLREQCERSPRVIAHFDHVPDDDVQVWFRAADVAVLPYRDILNSGAFLLAQTFGLPVVAPRAGVLRAWEGQPHVGLFEPSDPASLGEAIAEALDRVRRDPAGQVEHALAAARALSPETMASQYADLVAPWLSSPR